MNISIAEWKVRTEKNWTIMSVAGRLDSFNFEPFSRQLRGLIIAGHTQIALDLSETRFLSLPCIKYLTQLAQDLEMKGGYFALLAASEKLKRQIDIYATLNPMKVVRSVQELQGWDPNRKNSGGHSPVPSKSFSEI